MKTSQHINLEKKSEEQYIEFPDLVRILGNNILVLCSWRDATA